MPDRNDERPSELEGEGSYSADRKYREEVERFTKEADVEKLGKEAERDIEKDKETYRKAEEEGKRRIAEEDEADKDLI
jgi:hypothetical protein